MKKLVLSAVAVCVGFLGFAQNAPQVNKNITTHKALIEKRVGVEPIQTTNGAAVKSNTADFRAPNAVTVQAIGTSDNAYGFGYGGGQKTIVYYNGDLNTVTNIHRMGGELDPGGYNGDLGYDVSYDGGLTWTNMVETFVATEPSGQYYADAARYPQALIYNPDGNTDPANAHIAFMAATLDGTNDGWGGYGFGTQKLKSASNVDTTKNLWTSGAGIFRYIPDAMAFNRATESILVVDANYDVTGPLYQDKLIVLRGTWSDDANDIVYEESEIECPIIDKETTIRPACIRAAFAPNSEVGYIVVLGNNGENEPVYEGDKSYHPWLYKTEDGGQSWSDAINIQLDGPDGLEGILNYLTDAQIDSLFTDPNPERDEIAYTTAFDCDLTVDANGNPHIAVGISAAGSDEYSIISANPYYAIFDIYSTDGGESWKALELGRPENFRGEFGDLSEDSRVCVASNWDGTKVFFSWLDTDPEVNPDANAAPDIWARGFDPINNKITADVTGENAPTNVTFGSSAMWQSFFGTMASFVITDGDTYTLPLVYEEMTPEDPAKPVQFQYITNFSFTDADFSIQVGPAPLIANFTADETTIAMGTDVTFTDLSAGATSWEWTFEGGEPATSNEQNPVVTYAAAGEYDVTLTISNGSDTDTKEMLDYIIVYDPSGVEEAFASKFNVYPNPTNGMLNIRYTEINEVVEVNVIDNIGRVVAQRTLNPTGGSQLVSVDLTDLNQGIYQVQFLGAETAHVTKIVVR